MRLIDADAFDKRVRAAGGMSEEELSEDFKDGVQTVLYMMSKQPTITAQSERPRGKWIDYTEDGYVECPFCHSATNCDGNKDELHFCFSCGADMRGEKHETD